METRADYFAATRFTKLNVDFKNSLTNAIIQATKHKQKCFDYDNLYDLMNHTHPSPFKRIQALDAIVNSNVSSHQSYGDNALNPNKREIVNQQLLGDIED